MTAQKRKLRNFFVIAPVHHQNIERPSAVAHAAAAARKARAGSGGPPALQAHLARAAGACACGNARQPSRPAPAGQGKSVVVSRRHAPSRHRTPTASCGRGARCRADGRCGRWKMRREIQTFIPSSRRNAVSTAARRHGPSRLHLLRELLPARPRLSTATVRAGQQRPWKGRGRRPGRPTSRRAERNYATCKIQIPTEQVSSASPSTPNRSSSRASTAMCHGSAMYPLMHPLFGKKSAHFRLSRASTYAIT